MSHVCVFHSPKTWPEVNWSSRFVSVCILSDGLLACPVCNLPSPFVSRDYLQPPPRPWIRYRWVCFYTRGETKPSTCNPNVCSHSVTFGPVKRSRDVIAVLARSICGGVNAVMAIWVCSGPNPEKWEGALVPFANVLRCGSIKVRLNDKRSPDYRDLPWEASFPCSLTPLTHGSTGSSCERTSGCVCVRLCADCPCRYATAMRWLFPPVRINVLL